MNLKTSFQMLTCILFFDHLILNTTDAYPNVESKRLRHPNRQTLRILHRPHVYRSFITKSRSKINKLSLINITPELGTINGRVVRRPSNLNVSAKDKIFISGTRTTQAVTNNAFIEFDMRRAFVPKRITSQKLKSNIYISKSKNDNKTLSGERVRDVKKTALQDKFTDKALKTDSYSVEIDKKVLDKIQQLEKELIGMKNQVKNDTKTIDDLKNKVMEKDKKLTESTFTNQPPERKNVSQKMVIKDLESIPQIKIKSTNKIKSLKGNMSARIERETTEKPQLYVLNRKLFTRKGNTRNDKSKNTSKRYIGEEKKEFHTSPYPQGSIQDYELEKYTEIKNNIATLYQDITKKSISYGTHFHQSLDEVQSINRTKIDETTTTKDKENFLQEGIDYGHLNVSEPTYRDMYYKEDFGLVKPGIPNAYGSNKNKYFMNYDEYKRKLQDERIDGRIDWKNFNPQSFLTQLSAEIKSRTIGTDDDQELPTMIHQSGRRMLSDNVFNLTNADSLSANIGDQRKYTKALATNWFAPVPPKQRKLVLTTILPEPTEPLPSNFDKFNANDNFKISNEYLPSLSTFKTADKIPENIRPSDRRKLVPQAGKQKIILDSTELIIKNFLGNFNKGRTLAERPYDFDVIKQKMNRDDGKRRKMLHDRIAQRMTQKISGRRNMDPDEIVYNNYETHELFQDPFLNDSFI